MTTSVTVTGTGVPHLSPGRAGPGVLVRHGDVCLQFDAGRATALRLCEAGSSTGGLTALFVTHHHSDHLTGTTDLLMARWLENQQDFVPLAVVAPEGPATRLLSRLLDPWAEDIEVRQRHVGRTDHPRPEIIGFDVDGLEPATPVWTSADGAVTVFACAVHHEPVDPAVAYRIETPDGAVVVSGDTVVCEEVARLATGADVLVHEVCRTATLRPAFDAIAQLRLIANYHADSVELGALVARVGVPTVVLTHLIPAPGTAGLTAADYEADLRSSGYRGQVVVADDLTTVTIPPERSDAPGADES